jgi:tetratricopeptide (TPR) repeat protein
MIERAAGLARGEPPDVSRAKLRARVARNVPADDVARVAEFLGEVAGVPFAEAGRVELASARRDPMLLGDQIARAFEDLVGAEARERPLVLVLEDMHWSDAASVKVVGSALKNLRNHPLFVLQLARPEVHTVFPRIGDIASLQEVRLGELSRKASERLVREVLVDLDASVVDRIVTQAAGNALYLEELIRAVASGRTDALPETVIAMMQVRLEALEAEARRVLRAASVFGATFSRAGVAALLGGAERTTTLSDWLRELVEREVVVRRGSADREQYAFCHALVRDAAYAMLTDDDRRLGHRLAAEWLEASGAGDAVVLAEHFELAGEPARAVAWYARAADHALAQSDVQNAHALAGRALSCGATGEVEVEMLCVQSDALEFMGMPEAQIEHGRRTVALLEPGSLRWAEISIRMAVPSSISDPEPLRAVSERLLEDVPLDSPDAGPTLRAVAERAFPTLLRVGEQSLASRVLDRIVRASAHTREADPLVAAAIHTAMSWWALFTGDLAVSLRGEEAAAEAYEKAGNRRLGCKHRVGAGYSHLILGNYADAVRVLRAEIERARRMGTENTALNASHNLSMALGRIGQLDEAIAMQEDALAAYQQRGDVRLQGFCHIYLSRLRLLAGDVDGAEREGLQALEVITDPPFQATARAALARARLTRGDVDLAFPDAARAHELLEHLGSIEDGDESVRLVWAEALWAAGRHDEARAAIADARAKLLARAEKISERALRESYLTAVSENARTLELATAWLGSAVCSGAT